MFKRLLRAVTMSAFLITIGIGTVFAQKKPVATQKTPDAFIFGVRGKGGGQFGAPMGAAIAPDGTIYIADHGNNRISKFRSNGDFAGYFGDVANPLGIAVAPNGDIYVTGSSSLTIYNAKGDEVRKVKIKGSAHFVAVAPDGTFAVSHKSASKETHQTVDLYDKEGKFLHEIGGKSGMEDGHFQQVEGVAFLPDGSLIIADSKNARLQIFNKEGKLIGQMGDRKSLHTPTCIAVGPKGIIAVSEVLGGDVKIFDSDGKLLQRITTSGLEDGALSNPVGVAFTSDGKLLIVDSLNYRVQVVPVEDSKR